MNAVSIGVDDYKHYQRDADLADLVMDLAGIDKGTCTNIKLRDGVWRFSLIEHTGGKVLERTVVWAI